VGGEVSELLLGWPNGTLGLLLGAMTGLLILLRTLRDSPWDLHGERSYREPERLTLGVVGPSLLLLGVLVTLLLGLGALDKTIWPPFAFAGDILGLVILPLAALHALNRRQAGDS
jgi:hypothetical protein